ncbi:putative Ig domain-containing protein [Phyllobacterium sp. SB3]|uniref:putative Ig domain-containing protein n=1 Tax=Phyllobacterium sp. SB3 TaxID=3156073 RepID=UPI0032B00E9E
MKKLSALGGRISYVPGSLFVFCLTFVLLAAATMLSVNPASAQDCGPHNISVAHGGSVQLNAGGCDPFGLNNPSVTTPPAHGTVTVLNIDSGLIEYSHNGGSDVATSDSFVLAGAAGQSIPVNVTIGPASTMTISPGTLGSMRIAVSYSQNLSASGGTAPYSFTVVSGSIPGLSLNSGLISGTPTERGPHTLVVEVTDSTGATAQKSYGVTVDNPIMTTSPLNPALAVGVPSTASFTTTGGIAPYTYNVNTGTLPPGITLAANGSLTGTPSLAGTYTFDIVARESSTSSICNCPYFKVDTVTVTVAAAPTIVINPATITGATVAAAYSQTFTANGGTAPYTFSVSAGALPSGLTLDSATGVFAGTPTDSGTFNFTIRATDANSFTGDRAYSLTIAPPTVEVVAEPLPVEQVGVPFSRSLSADGGTEPYTYAITGGSLPPGKVLASDGTISGSPTQAGTFTFTVTATDSTGGTGPFSGSQGFTILVNPAPLVLPATSLANATVGSAYSASINPATGGVSPYTYVVTAGALPAGISFSAAGGLSGTPTAAGAFNFTVTAADSASVTATQNYSLNISAPTLSMTPVAGNLVLPYGQPSTYNFSASGGTSPYSYSLVAGSLPVGISFSAAGVLSGTPTVPGNYNIAIRATDSSTGSGAPFSLQSNYTLQVGAPTMAITPPTLANAQVGIAYASTLTASGGVGPYSFALISGALPIGVSFNSAGQLSGTPSTSGAFALNIRATDANGQFVSQAFTLNVDAPTISVAPATLSAGSVASSYSETVSATGGTAPYSYAITAGSLPAGLTLNTSTGVISGTPTTEINANFTVTATDSTGGAGPYNASRAYTLVINAPTISLPATTLANGTVATAYTATLNGASGGTAPYSYAVTGGALPAGLTLASDGIISGTPTTQVNSTFTVTATDNSPGPGPYTATQTYTLIVDAPTLSLPATTLANGTVATAYTAALNGAVGGTAPYTYAVTGGALPAGLTLASDGTISGTPTTQVNANFIVTATDNSPSPGPYTASRAYTLIIDAPTISLPATTLADGVIATAYTATLNAASGGTSPYTYAVTGGALPAGLSLAADGTISGTPTAQVNANFVVTATDNSPAPGPYTASRAYTLAIAAPTLVFPDTTLAGGTIGTAYSASLNPASGGTAPYSYAVTAGALPVGLTLSATGSITGTPTAVENANFTVTATDASPAPGPYTISRAFMITTVDTVPVANPVTATVAYQSGPNPITLNITGGTPTSVAVSTAPTSGTAVASGTTIAYQPATGFAGTASFAYTASNASGTSAPATVTVTVTATPPVAQPLAVSVLFNQAKNFTLTATGAGTLTFELQTAPANGTMVVGTSGSSTYTPNTGFSGADSATYKVTGVGGVASANVTFTVAGPAVVAELTGLLPNAGTLQPAFSPTVGSYRLKLPNTQETITLTPTSRDANSRVTVQGRAVTSGSPSQAIKLVVGETRIVVIVTAQDGSALKTYEVIAERLPPAPVAASRSVEVIAGQSARVDLTEGSTGGPFSAARLVSLSNPDAGRVTIEKNGNRYDMVYASKEAFGGSLEAKYTLANAYGTSSPATITFVVIARPDPSKDPEVIGLLTAQADSAKRFATNQIKNFNSRLEQLHDEGDRRSNSMAVRLGFTEQDEPDEMDEPFDSVLRKDAASKYMDQSSNGVPDFAAHSFAEEERKKKDGQPAPELNMGRLAVWTGGFVNFGERDDDGLNLDYTTVGVSAGMDYRFSKKFVAGFGFGYGRDATDIGENGTESRANAYSAAVYGSYSPIKSVFIDGLLGGSWLDFNSERYITSTGDFASGDRDGTQIFGSLTASYEHRTEAWLVSPYGRLDFSRSWLDGFTEKGGNGLALQYGEQTVDTLSGILGIRLEYTMPMDWGVLKPGVRAEYTHDFEGSSRVKLGYADIGGLPYDVETENSGDDYVTFGASLDAALNSDWSTNFDYRTTVGADDQNHAFGLRVAKRF